MITILEGPDGGGKTRLAEELRSGNPHRPYVHHGLYPDDTGEELLWRYTRSILDNPGGIFDRCFLSESVYGLVMRNKNRLGKIGIALLTRLTKARGAAEVICLPPYALALENWKAKRGDYVPDQLKYAGIYGGFERLLKDDHYIHYDYTWAAKSRDHLARLENAKRRMTFIGNWLPDYALGSPEAKYLIVGERVSLPASTLELPFYSMRGVSGWLFDRLQGTDLKEDDLAFVNANHLHGHENDLWNVVKHLPNFQRAVGLGKVAELSLDFNCIPYTSIPHPSYWKRFQYKKPEVYSELLQEAANGDSAKVGKLLRGMDSTTPESTIVGASNRS